MEFGGWEALLERVADVRDGVKENVEDALEGVRNRLDSWRGDGRVNDKRNNKSFDRLRLLQQKRMGSKKLLGSTYKGPSAPPAWRPQRTRGARPSAAI